MATDERAYEPTERPAILAQVGLVLAAPVAWFVQMQTNYTLVGWACAHGSSLVLHAVTVLALAASAGAGLAAWRAWRRFGVEGDDAGGDPAARSRFMAATAALTSAMFFLVILAQGIAPVIQSPCQP
jgi:hypothetical protein